MSRRGKQEKKKKAPGGGGAGIKIEVLQSDMDQETQKAVIQLVRKNFDEAEIEKDLAAQVKKGMDKEYPETTWHVIVGTHFGVSITHSTNNLMFLQANSQNVLVFKSLD